VDQVHTESSSGHGRSRSSWTCSEPGRGRFLGVHTVSRSATGRIDNEINMEVVNGPPIAFLAHTRSSSHVAPPKTGMGVVARRSGCGCRRRSRDDAITSGDREDSSRFGNRGPVEPVERVWEDFLGGGGRDCAPLALARPILPLRQVAERAGRGRCGPEEPVRSREGIRTEDFEARL
jgi:hypothetical protein